MKTLKVGEIAIASLIERDGPWRTPEAMFPAYDPEIGRRRLAELDPIVFDPAAKYIFHKGEYEHWEAVSSRGEAPPGILEGKLPGNSWSYNCRPIVEAGQALLVDDEFQLDDNFTLIPTPGHSPGHCCVMIRSQGQGAVVTGDLMHHALQCREPDWSTIFDTDPVQAAQSRRRLLGQVAETGTFVLPIHLPNPTTGLVSANGDRFRYTFVR